MRPGRGGVTGASYGVLYDHDPPGNVMCLCGVGDLLLAKTTDAIFFHSAHISKWRDTWQHSWNKWARDQRIGSGARFERYTGPCNPVTGLGGAEIWIPLEV